MTTITQAITPLPTAPDPATMTREQFNTAAAAFVIAQKAEAVELETFRTQANAMASGLNAIATGAALSIPLTFSTTTTDSDPGNGIVRLDNATQNAATAIRTDLIGNDGSTWTSVIDLFDDSTSVVKGFITLVDITDATKWLVFSVSAVALPAGYRNISVICVASSAANPFANGASLALKFARTGDKGDTGAGITPQTVGWTATAGTTPHTLTQDVDLTASNVATLNGAQTFITGLKKFTNSLLALLGSSTGWTVFTSANASATSYTITVPAADMTMAGINNAQSFSLGQACTPANLPASSGNATAVNFALGNKLVLPTLTENTTLGAPSNPTVGQPIIIHGTQHASAAKTVAYHTDFIWTTSTTPVVPTTVGAQFAIIGEVRPDGKFLCSMVKAAGVA